MGKAKPRRGPAGAGSGAPKRPAPTLSAAATLMRRVRELGGVIVGDDDTGRTYAGLEELWRVQGQRREKYYRTNTAWWGTGYEGRATVEGAMIGDDASDADVAHSRAFLEARAEACARRVHVACTRACVCERARACV